MMTIEFTKVDSDKYTARITKRNSPGAFHAELTKLENCWRAEYLGARIGYGSTRLAALQDGNCVFFPGLYGWWEE